MSAYSAAVLADAPLHYWRMSDPGGQVARDLGSSPLALHAGFYLARLGYTGPVSDGGSVFLTDQGVMWFPSASISYTQPLSLELWFWQTFDNGAEMKLLSTENNATYQGLGIHMSTGRKPGIFGFNSSLDSAGAIALNTWVHIVVRHDSTTRDVLVNGVLQASGAQAFTNGSGMISVGARGSDRTNFTEGFIGEVAMYNSILSTARCLAHYNAADQKTAFPTYQPEGTQSASTGAPTYSASDVTQIAADTTSIKNAVIHTFPAT